MRPDIAACYETLSLPQTATPEDVKKAYFRLIRKFSPEKDPEQFQNIRRAYETLKDGAQAPESDSEEFSEPDHPLVRHFLAEAAESFKEQEYAESIDFIETALEYAPDEPLALLNMMIAQLKAGHSQLAAKYGEHLVRLKPESQTAHRLLAITLYDRGWYKKALPVFRKAYGMGVRNMDFLFDYCQCLDDSGNRQEAHDLRWTIADQTAWNKSNIQYALIIYTDIAESALSYDAGLGRFLDSYEAFLSKNRRLLKNDPADIPNPVFAIAKEEQAALYTIRPEEYRRLDRIVETFSREYPNMRMHCETLRDMVLLKAFREDPRSFHEDWIDLAEVPLVDYSYDEKLRRYIELDAILCTVTDWDAVGNQFEAVRSDYPRLYERYADILDKMASGEREPLIKSLNWEFAKLSAQYRGAKYTERLKQKASETMRFITQDSETPYVRSAEKVGRNDPCPCGSGKKFKKCCMGKGLYD